MDDAALSFEKRYATALAAFVALPEEESLERAYDLGREAISQGRGVLDLAAIHAVASAGAWQFFTEALAPFEMALRGFRDANRALKEMATTLEERVLARTRELTAKEQAFREQAQILRSVLDSISDGIAVTDKRGNLLLFNGAGERLVRMGATGASPDDCSEAYGIFRADTVTPVPRAELPLVRAMQGEQTAAVSLFLRNPALPQGVHLSVVGSPLRGEDGTVQGGVVVLRDTTEARYAEARLNQVQRMEAIGRLAGGVAHDFNNILSVILGYAEIVSNDLEEDHPRIADLKEISKAGLRAGALTKQLLAFSRQQVLEPKVLDLNQSLAGVTEMLRQLLGADIELTMLPAVELWSVKAEPGQIDQILMNLAVNARDAMPEGGKLTIETKNVELDDDYARAHDDVTPGLYVAVMVSDTGMGMSRETQARIFEPFFTTKEQGKGTGLGLATVFGIVKQSGGHIWLYSEPGKGAMFKVHFPRVNGPAQASASTRPEAEPARGTETILLVEDDDQVRVLARDILRRNGYVVLEAPNGGEALLICEQHTAHIHLLLTDVVLPRMSGRQLAERLESLRPRMKVLFMSGYTDDAILQHGILESGVSFLHKPLTQSSLTRKVREALNRET